MLRGSAPRAGARRAAEPAGLSVRPGIHPYPSPLLLTMPRISAEALHAHYGGDQQGRRTRRLWTNGQALRVAPRLLLSGHGGVARRSHARTSQRSDRALILLHPSAHHAHTSALPGAREPGVRIESYSNRLRNSRYHLGPTVSRHRPQRCFPNRSEP